MAVSFAVLGVNHLIDVPSARTVQLPVNDATRVAPASVVSNMARRTPVWTDKERSARKGSSEARINAKVSQRMAIMGLLPRSRRVSYLSKSFVPATRLNRVFSTRGRGNIRMGIFPSSSFSNGRRGDSDNDCCSHPRCRTTVPSPRRLLPVLWPAYVIYATASRGTASRWCSG